MFREFDRVREDCPVCGKKEGATQGATSWGHSYSCCSDECGMELKKRLDILHNSKEYKTIKKIVEDNKNKLDSMELKVTKGQENIRNRMSILY
jgi:hypothetical protein